MFINVYFGNQQDSKEEADGDADENADDDSKEQIDAADSGEQNDTADSGEQNDPADSGEQAADDQVCKKIIQIFFINLKI